MAGWARSPNRAPPRERHRLPLPAELHLCRWRVSSTYRRVPSNSVKAMSEPFVANATPPEPTRARPPLRRETGAERLGNRVLAAILVCVVLVAPLPVGSNRGAAWMLWALLIAALAVAYVVASWRGYGRLRLGGLPRSVVWLLVFFMLFAVVQLAPLMAYLPTGVAPLPGSVASVPPGISVAPAATIVAVLRFATGVVFLVLMLAVTRSRRRTQGIAWVLFLAVLVYAIWAILSLRYLGGTLFWGEKPGYSGVATGPFINRNSFATFLGMGAVLGLALGLDQLHSARHGAQHTHPWLGPRGMAFALSIVCVSVILVVQLATQSRMGVAATLVALSVVWGLSHRPGTSRVVLWLGLGGGALIAGLALITQGAELADRLIVAEGDFDGRQALYRQVWQMILARPLTGYGLDAFPAAFELFHRPPVSAGVIWDNAHSSYLTLWVEMGLIVGSIPPLVALLIGLRLWRNLETNRTLAAAALGCLVLVGSACDGRFQH